MTQQKPPADFTQEWLKRYEAALLSLARRYARPPLALPEGKR